MPEAVRGAFGRQLLDVQYGDTPAGSSVLRGFGGAGVRELKQDGPGATYRAVFAVEFSEAVYVLHVFKKKSVKGMSTRRADLELIRYRLREAARHHWLAYRGGPEQGEDA